MKRRRKENIEGFVRFQSPTIFMADFQYFSRIFPSKPFLSDWGALWFYNDIQLGNSITGQYQNTFFTFPIIKNKKLEQISGG